MTSFTGCNVTFSSRHGVNFVLVRHKILSSSAKLLPSTERVEIVETNLRFTIMSINFIDTLGRQIVFFEIKVRRHCALNCIFLTPKRNEV